MPSPFEAYLRQVIAADAPSSGIAPAAIRGGLGALAGLYDAGLTAYLAAEQIGLRRRERLPIPVICIGNLSVGGTGKTPMTILLASLLKDAGLRLAILSRGHGGSSQAPRVVSSGDASAILPAEDAGDEPVLLARRCPDIPVLVGKDRYLSGREAMRRWALDLALLDDGFQYWQLARDLDIVLLDSRHPFDNGRPLPRGLLREPARNIRRAGMAVITRAGRLDAAGREVLQSQVAVLAADIPIYFADHAPVSLVPAGALSDPETPLDTLADVPVLAVSAIAQPASFHETLERATGCRIAGSIVKDDHGRYDADAVSEAIAEAGRVGAEAIVMTEKDAVKWPAVPSTIPVYALRIAMRVERQDEFLADVLERCGV